ncbi:hypothetical protein JCM21900_001092 [Sporobolomyces salmonicolor]
MSSCNIRLTEPQVFLVGALEYERARARQRRAVARAANRPPTGSTPPPSPGPSSRRNSPERARHTSASRAGSRSRPGSRTASPAPRGRLLGQVAHGEEGFVPPNSRGRSASRTRAPMRPRDDSESLSVGRSGSLVRDSAAQEEHEEQVLPEQAALDEPPQALLRGLLTVTLSKPTRVKEIHVRFKGMARTDWPEGIGPRRLDVMEENTLINVTHTFFSASQSSTARRAASVGPGATDHGRNESRGRTSSRRSASVMPAREMSHGRSYPRDSMFPDGLNGPPPSSSATSTRPNTSDESSRPSTVLSRIASSADLEAMHDSDIPPVQPGEAAPAYEMVPSLPSSPMQRPQRAPNCPTPDSFDLATSLSATLRSSASSPRSPTPSRSPLGMSHSTLNDSPSSSPHGPTHLLSQLRRTPTSTSRLSQESSSTASSGADSSDRSPPGRSSSSVLSFSPSEIGRGRPPTRDQFQVGAGSDPAGEIDLVSNGIAGVARQSRTSLHLSPTPSPAPSVSATNAAPTPNSGRRRRPSSTSSSATARRSASASSSTLPPSAMRTGSGAGRSMSRARFALSGISEVLRGKSSTRARAPPHDDDAGSVRRAPSPDAGSRRSSSAVGTGRSQSRGRKTALKVLREALTAGHSGHHHHHDGDGSGDEGSGGKHSGETASGDGWKEFKAGTYTYPISISVPGTLPPSLTCEFGHVAYSLKATVVRAGALTSNLTATTEVTLVATPGEDDTEETESIVVERFWETQMKYHVALSGKSFPIGGQIPITIRLSPLAKVKLYRVSAQLEQKISYFASANSGRKLTRHETPRRINLVKIEHKDPKEFMLPIISDDADALLEHPLKEWFINATSSDDTTPSLLDPDGPWFLESHIQLPDCSSKITFSTQHEKANIAVSHVLKIVMRVERGDDEYLDSKGKRKAWDIIVEAPCHILSCRCSQNFLPAYSASTAVLSAAGPSSAASAPSPSILSRALRPIVSSSAPHDHVCGSATAPSSARAPNVIGIGTASTGRSHSAHPAPVATLEQNLLFARLLSGETTPAGDTPPTYDEVAEGRAGQGERGRSSTVVVVDEEDERGRSSSTRRAPRA